MYTVQVKGKSKNRKRKGKGEEISEIFRPFCTLLAVFRPQCLRLSVTGFRLGEVLEQHPPKKFYIYFLKICFTTSISMKTMSWILSNSRRLNTISGRTNRSNPQLPVDRYYCLNQPQPVVSEIIN